MAHYYVLENGIAKRYRPLNKDGTEKQRIPRKMAIDAGAVEGVTTLLKRVDDQSGLITWAGNLGVQCGLGAKNLEEGKKLFAEKRDESSNIGTLIHDAIERAIRNECVDIQSEAFRTAVSSAKSFLNRNEIFDIYAEHCVVFHGEQNAGEPMHFGGTIDVLSRNALVDWKTVSYDPGTKAAHAAQIAAYRLAANHMGLCVDNARCFNVYISRDTGMIVRETLWSEQQLTDGLSLLYCAYKAGTLVDSIEGA